MTRTSELWTASTDLAQACLDHPFVQGLGDGTLDPARYRFFIAQDAFFLESFARGYAHCLAQSPNSEGLYAFFDLLSGVFEELALHKQVAEREGIDLAGVTPAPATLAYTDFLDESAVRGGTLGEAMAAMTPCMRLYAYIGQSLDQSRASDTVYGEWIDTYANAGMEELAALLETLLTQYGDGSEVEAQRYRRAMELELGFFESAWQSVS